jgi:hypothetical protein
MQLVVVVVVAVVRGKTMMYYEDSAVRRWRNPIFSSFFSHDLFRFCLFFKDVFILFQLY